MVIKMTDKCCWNEEKEEWYDYVTIGCGKVMCECCNTKYDLEEIENNE